MTPLPLRALVSAIGFFVAITTTIAIPAGYLFVGYADVTNNLAYKAELDAANLGKFIYSYDGAWPFQYSRVAELIEQTRMANEHIRKRVIDAQGKLVLQEGDVLASPIVMHRTPIRVAGTTVGTVEVETSIRQLIVESIAVSLVSFLLGFGMYFAVRVFPLRVLDRTLGELKAATRAIQIGSEQLRVQNARFDAALSNMSQGLCMFDGENRLVIANRRIAEIFRIPFEQLEFGMETEEILTLAVDSGSLTRQDARDLIDRQDDLIGFRQPGSLLWELSDGRTISLVHQPIPNGWRIATLQDVTEGRQAAATIAHMTRHDALTGLPNRVQFRDHLGQSLSLVRRGEPLAVLCLDLDHFKGVNDTLGHPTGDLLLQAVAERLRASLRPTDMVARLGGDEFAIVQQSLALVEDATALAGRILDIVGAPYDLDGHKVVVATSVGVALAPADGVDPDRLLKNADMALYRAKAEGRGTYRFFEPEMDARMQARRALELDLRSAVGAGQFELFYQPIVDARSERTTGFEALLRWRHPQRGMVSPVDFIALTEETGLIVPLGEWVLRQACEEAARWPDDLRVAVNLSPAQFKCRNLVEVVLSALAGSGLPPGRLELEITETVLLQENDTNLATLHQLRSLGVRISMDDFGTGYSSLSYLRSFPFDKIKIDRSFIRDSAERSDCLAIIRAVAGLGSSLGIGTLAEGVETAEQLRCIQAEGCTEVQGYYFSPPVPAHGIPHLLERTGWPRRAVA